MSWDFDLSSREGMRAAIDEIRKVPILGHLYSPHLWLVEKVFDFVEPGKAAEKQAKAAIDLIKAGRENGVKKMKVTMDEQAGMHFDAPVIDGVRVAASVGSKGKM